MSYKTYTPREIIKFARENSPYYKELYKDIPEDATLLPHYTAAPLLGLPFLLILGLTTGWKMKRRKAYEETGVDYDLNMDAGIACKGP